MPRQRLDLEQYREDIVALWDNGDSVNEILRTITNGGIQVAKPTLERRLKDWGLHRRPRGQVTSEVIELVRFFFFHFGFSDKSILRELHKNGSSLTLSGLQTLRQRNGMKRRYRTIEERNEALYQATQFLEQDIQQTSLIRNFGRGYLYQYVRLKAGIVVGKHQLYEYYKQQWPEEVSRRRETNWKHRTEFKVPGPNFLWSLDGYEKLKAFGFQVKFIFVRYRKSLKLSLGLWLY